MQELTGIHHVTAITSSAEKIYDFFNDILGMRLVKKTVNQDDISTYHLFFADDAGNAGTDMTFFDFEGIQKGKHGTNEIARTSFRVPNDKAVEYFLERFEQFNVKHEGIQEMFGRKILPFEDFDGQLYQIISDENDKGVAPGTPWKNGPVPVEYAIHGLGPVFITVSQFTAFKSAFEKVYMFKETASEDNYHLFETGEGGNGASVIIVDDTTSAAAYQGFGTVHHVAFRVPDEKGLNEWIERLQEFGLPNSGYVDRFFFKSLYARLAMPILFEIATDGPGFMGDEPYETLGEKLSLPPFLEGKREEIEKQVRHIDTVRSK
ncbi:ring-cleaving dioxygenase [Macrococcoides canis]|uniref:Ring-cleaving dioxygenase MhqA n=1 Tax=Macrococcoides canis TaxID=1855823 RepID=A0A1W7A8E7_9STAP|nr:ring-cleaving dioxygenase [Macrococcus canis]ARQ05828.1 Putative ring-cleaving dioxygenase MhqA [Macrococcus canis]UJS27928.1 ring-cleaving dioxygenase [Macrococcus canis]UTH11675.1 ring-cleaving dioxygenase [Macrococcus canis]WBF52792.1 ring-cleaving dioxygenase [Macrococcus canis]